MIFLESSINFCENVDALQISLVINRVINIIFIIVPIILIALVTRDFFKNVTEKSESDARKNLQNAINRILIAVVIFFVPAIVRIALNVVSKSTYAELIQNAKCFTNVSEKRIEELKENAE